MNLRLLRIFLLLAALGWIVCIVGVFASWSRTVGILHDLGGPVMPYDRMMDYWLRMIAAACTLVGLLYLLLALQPAKYRAIIPWFGWVMVLEGIVLLVHGLKLGLPPFPFYGDVIASFVSGVGILWFAPRAEYDAPIAGN